VVHPSQHQIEYQFFVLEIVVLSANSFLSYRSRSFPQQFLSDHSSVRPFYNGEVSSPALHYYVPVVWNLH
jgi:hypothetical protein